MATCSHCGRDIRDPNQKFCDKCGEEWNNSFSISKPSARDRIYRIIASNYLPILSRRKDEKSLYLKGYSENHSFPMRKVRKGISTFGRGLELDDVLAYYDDTLFGGGDLGFILADDGVYHKQAFGDKDYFGYDNIEYVEKCSIGIKVNINYDVVKIACTEKPIIAATIDILTYLKDFKR